MSANTHPAYRPDIDGLRAVAVLAVVLFHGLPNIIQGGFVGVDIFFVISGYLISSILMKEHEAKQFTYQAFYIRRIRRIFPALITVLAFVFVLGWFSLFADEFSQLGKHIAGGGLFSANLVFWSEAGYFDADSGEKLLLHLWSLGIEEQFYIFWPIILGIIWKPCWVATGIAAFIVVSFVTNIVLTGSNPTAAFYFPLSRFWELLAGALLAWVQLTRPSTLDRFKSTQALLGVALLLAGFILIHEARAFPGYWVLLPVFGSLLLISAGPETPINRWLLGNKIMVWFGLISYPLYLWHWPIMAFIRISKDGDLNRPWALRAVAFSILLAWLTYRFIETPFRKGAPSLRKITGLSIVMMIIVIAGFSVYLANGIPSRKAANVADPILMQDIKQHHLAYQSDGNCTSLVRNIISPETPVCMSKTPIPTLAIMGDSHGMSFNMASVLGKLDLDAIYIGRPACLPFTRYMAYSTFKAVNAEACLKSSQIALDFLKDNQSVKNVVLINRGLSYIQSRGKFWYVDRNGNPIDAVDAYTEGYSDTISEIEKSGKHAILMLEWPNLKSHPKGCIGTRLISIGSRFDTADCVVPKEEILRERQPYLKIVETLAKRHPNLTIYDPINIFCDNDYCYGLRNGRALFTDIDHLSLYGSEMIATDFIRHFLSPATMDGANTASPDN